MLTRVTITGADDRVDPRVLVGLSAYYPFVEWGILFSTSRAGQPRYPTADWVWALARAAGRRPVKLSAHLCGICARDTLAGSPAWIEALPSAFDRVQLNGYEKLSPAFVEMAKKLHSSPEFILQARTPEGRDQAMGDEDLIPRGSTLVDPSGGTGLDSRSAWASADSTAEWIGFAGGIAPGNVEESVAFINEHRSMPYFIDMESGVREDDRFNIQLVAEVLERTAPLIGVSS